MITALNPSACTADWGKIFLLGVRIDDLSLDQLLFQLQSCTLTEEPHIFSYANIHALNIAHSTKWFRDFLLQSRLTFCDGVGLQAAAALTRQKLAHRFTPPDFMEHICASAVRRGWRLYFLGAKPGIAGQAAEIMRSKFPGLQIESHHGYFDKTQSGVDNTSVVHAINGFSPDFLFVGFGMPLQERWILDNANNLDAAIVFPVGALFDYVSGALPRAPRWMTDNGLEWLGRLVIEPRRLWKRYIFGNPLFFLRLIAHHSLGIPLPE